MKVSTRFGIVFGVIVAACLLNLLPLLGNKEVVRTDSKSEPERVVYTKEEAYNVFQRGFSAPLMGFFKKKLPGSNGEYVDVIPRPGKKSYWMKLSPVISDSVLISGASLTALPSTIENGERVTVMWTSVPADPIHKYRSDWIGLYCPSYAKPNDYLDYWFVSESPTYYQGYGSAQFALYNLRTDCEFRYYRNDTYTELLAVSNKVDFVNGKAAPIHGHLALTGDATQMRVHWTSGTYSTPTVHYGKSPYNLNNTAMGISRSYKNTDMCGPPANESRFFLNPGYLHDVLLTGLVPNTRYYYEYGSGHVFSEMKSFMSALPKGYSTPFTFIVYGDMGISDAAEQNAKLVKKEVVSGSSFVLHVGDLSYAVGFAYKWEHWMTLIEPYSTLAPYMVCIGNHEYDYLVGGEKDLSNSGTMGFHPSWGNYGHDSGGECGIPLYYRFHMPDSGNSLWWYSYDYGLAHFTVFSTEHNFTAGSPQYEWIKKDLQSLDRNRTPWVIVFGHRLMYGSPNTAYNDLRISSSIREALEELLYEYQVDLAFWGHCHAYMRSCAVYKRQCNRKGTVHIIVGTGGFTTEPDNGYDLHWVIHYEDTHGYGRVTVANSSALLFQYVRNSDLSVADSVWLQKN